MADQMSKRERLKALQLGEQTDRPAWSLWRHFYDQESSAEDLAEAMVAWQRRHDFDFLKINPRAQYHVEPWGARYRYPGGGARPFPTSVPVVDSSDWMRIERRLATTGSFGEQLEAIGRIREALGSEVPMIQTIFTPLSVVGDLVASDERLMQDLRTVPELVVGALEAVTQTLVPYAAACLDAGADGIFLATTQWASRELLSDEEYARFGRPYDLRVLAAVAGGSFNVLHVCGRNAMVFELADYPVQAINWAVTDPTTPTLAEAAARVERVLIGGVGCEAFAGTADTAATAQGRSAYEAAQGRRWILGADCTIRPTSQDVNLEALKHEVHQGFATQ